jgi:hypothetical protein
MVATRAWAGPVTQSLRWRVDPARSEASVHGEHMGTPWVDALMRGLAGELLLDPSDPCGCSFAVSASRAQLYVGEPRLNTQLRLEELVPRGGAVQINGVLSAGVPPGGYHAEVHHTLAGLPSPLTMAAELRSSSTLSLPMRGPEPVWSWRVSMTAHPLDGLERLHLHIEAELADPELPAWAAHPDIPS